MLYEYIFYFIITVFTLFLYYSYLMKIFEGFLSKKFDLDLIILLLTIFSWITMIITMYFNIITDKTSFYIFIMCSIPLALSKLFTR